MPLSPGILFLFFAIGETDCNNNNKKKGSGPLLF